MPYVSNGQVLESRSPWRLSIIPELIWGFFNFIVLFFQTMVNPNKTSKGDGFTSDYRRPGGGGGGGGGGPRRRMGGFGGRGAGAAGPPPMPAGG